MQAFLMAVLLRPLVPAVLAGLLMVRVKSAAGRHALWSVVTVGMLAIALAIVTLPAVPVRVMRPAARPVVMAFATPFATPSIPAAPARPFPWDTLLEAIYATGIAALAGRLGYGYRLTRKLVNGSRAIPRFAGEAVYESDCVAVPLTIGWLRPRVLLPAGWDAWTPEKLDAVLIHERNHVLRADWAIAVLSGVNCCVFWFHPLAWWLDARLKALAEEACDDASLQHVASREFYAQVLVEIAAAVRAGEGRAGWGAVAMAKGAEVRMRVERILDEGRQIATAMTRGRWVLLAVCAVPVIYLSAVMRPARAQAQAQVQATPVVVEQAQPQSKEAREELARIEAEITKFKRENMGRLPEQFQANVVQLNTLQMMSGQCHESLGRLQQERLLLETRLQNLNAQLRFHANSSPDAEKLAEQQVHGLRLQLEDAKETLTPQHPRLRRLQEDLASAEKMLAAIESQGSVAERKAAIDLEGSINMVKAEMQNINLQMDEKAKQAQEINQQIGAYQQRIESSPGLEGHYAELMREYESAQQRYAESQYGHEGKVQLSITFGPDGRPRDIRVLHGHGPAQDEKAIEWAKSLRFVPPAGEGTLTLEMPVQTR